MSTIEEQYTRQMQAERVKAELMLYAEGRRKSVSDGCEAPRFAALLLQKFGYGMWKMAEALGDRPLANDLFELTDKLVSEIDSNWQENAQDRWSMGSVDFRATRIGG